MHYKTTFIKVSENLLFHSLFTACVLKQSRFLKIQETYFLVFITFVPQHCQWAIPLGFLDHYSYLFTFFVSLKMLILLAVELWIERAVKTCFDAHGGDRCWSHWGSWCWGLGVHMGSGSPDGLAESLARSQWKLGWLKVSFPSFQRLKAVEIVQSFFWLYKYFVLQIRFFCTSANAERENRV